MKITLDLDPSLLSTEVSEFVKTLSAEDKQAMVKQIVTEYYTDYRKFEEGEKATKEQEVIEQIRRGFSDYDKRNYGTTDDDIRKYYKFAEEMKKIKTFSQITREEISNAIRGQLVTQINEFIKNDETYKALLTESMEAVKERFPLMVQQAMITHFSGQLPEIIRQVQNLVGPFYDRLNQIEQKLLR